MNRKDYLSEPRYAKVLEKMDLLGIMDISTTRQHKNGTIVWKLPIKDQDTGILIEVASFDSGYVRNQNSCYSNFQLNKRCESEPDYYKIERNGETLYRKFTTRTCRLIPIEIDRLEYLISYCLKNYYIKHANFVPDGEYVPKWRYDNLADAARLDYDKSYSDKWKTDKLIELRKEIQTLEENLDDAVCTIVKHETYYVKLEDKIRDLENKLQSIIRTARH